jgi:hypothetical protein
MSRYHFKSVLTGLRDLRYMVRRKPLRAYIDALIEDQTIGLERFDEAINDAKMHGVRNPEFDDDWVGRPDDDFDDDEE